MHWCTTPSYNFCFGIILRRQNSFCPPTYIIPNAVASSHIFFMVAITRSGSRNSTTMSSSDSTISRADLDAQSTQMNARFDAIMLLLEDHTKIKK
jgi:hypothetical protein